MNPGDLIFVSGTDWMSRIIRWVTKSSYSHVAVYTGFGYVMEAQGFRRLGFRCLLIYDGEYDAKPLPPVTPDKLREGLNWLYSQRGRRYSYWSDFVILMRCLFGIAIPWKEGKAIMCARLARDFLFHCGLNIPDEDMSPEDLAEWLDAQRKG